MTKKEMFANIATLLAGNEEVVDFCNHEIELLENRKTSKHGMTKVQKANVEVKEAIVNALAAAGSALTVTELLTCEGLAGYTNQKISALLRQLVDAKVVIKAIEGKKSRFSLA